MKNTFLLLCLFSCSNLNFENKLKVNEAEKRKRDIDDIGYKEREIPQLQTLSIQKIL